MTKKRLIASTVMEKQRAIKKTALISAPTTWTQFDQHIVLSLIAVSFPNPLPTGMTFMAVGEYYERSKDNFGNKSHLCPGPPKCVLLPLLWAHADADIGNHEGNHIAEHVEAVGNEGHAVGDVADDQLDHHVCGRHCQHSKQPGL